MIMNYDDDGNMRDDIDDDDDDNDDCILRITQQSLGGELVGIIWPHCEYAPHDGHGDDDEDKTNHDYDDDGGIQLNDVGADNDAA